MDAKYTEETIDELLSWVKERLEKKDYPTETVYLSTSTKIPNSASFLQAMLTTVSANWKNPIFHPLVDELRQYRELWESKISN